MVAAGFTAGLAKTFLSFARLVDPAWHRAYNIWHHLDHRPEVLALPGIHWGERWVLSPECAEVAVATDERFADFHYLTLYWLREPLRESVDAFLKLSQQCFHWGRHPEIEKIERPYMGWADPVKGFASADMMMTPEVVPIRPHRGVHVSIARLTGSATGVNAALHWQHRTALPALMQVPGVIGGWSFVETAGPEGHANWTDHRAALRFRILWLDDDPVGWAEAHGAEVWECAAVEDGREERLLDTPMLSIAAYDYDWFERGARE